MLIKDRNNNQRYDHSDRILFRQTLPSGMTASWHSFRNKPWLKFTNRATSYYQNGHFELCYGRMAIRVIMTRIGRPRVERGGIRKDGCTSP